MHILLIGDSLFDNAAYVDAGDSVLDLLRIALDGTKVTLAAVDGAASTDIRGQLDAFAQDTTHIFVSCGANDALQAAPVIHAPVSSVNAALNLLSAMREQFRDNYVAMLHAILEKGCATTVCTIHNKIPGMEPGYLTALALFNEVITEEAAKRGLPMIDLRTLCWQAQDYSSVNPIEPSLQGGAKIARAIVHVLRHHRPDTEDTTLYAASLAAPGDEQHAALAGRAGRMTGETR